MDQEQLQPAPQPELSDLKAKYESLHQAVISMMLLMIVVTGTLWIFLMRQVKFTSADLEFAKAQTTNMVAQFRLREPAMDEFVRKLEEFGRTNPDYQPYLAKYGLKGAPSPAASPVIPKPVAPPPAKK